MTTLTFFLVILSALMHATWNLVAKKYSGNYSVIYLSFLFSSVATGLLSLPYWESIECSGATIALLLTTGVLHAVYGFVLTFAYKNGDMSTVYPIIRGSGIAGSVMLSLVILHESLSAVSGFGVCLVIAGIAMLSYRRNRVATSPKGLFLALLCGAFIMSYTIIDKILVDGIHPIPVLAASQLISVFLFLPYVLLKRKEELKMTFKTLLKPTLIISVVATSSYLIILYAMQLAPIGRIVAVREASVVFGAVAGYLVLKETFSKTRLAGVIIVMIGIVMVKM